MKLIDKLPYFYEECPKTNTMQDGLGIEVDNLYSKVEGTINQLYINSSTWALGEWEKFAGVKKTDGTIEERRLRVASKLKAKSTTTLNVMTSLCKSYVDDAKVVEIFNEYVILLELIVKSDNDIPKEFNITSIDRDIWEVKPAHLEHRININNSRKLNIKTNYEGVNFRYIPCNAIYAGQTQPNTYIKDSELTIITPIKEEENKNSCVLGNAIIGIATLGIGG